MKNNRKYRKRYKIVGRWIPIGEYQIPQEFEELIEQQLHLHLAIEHLKALNHFLIAPNDTQAARDFSYAMLSSQIALAKSWQRHMRRRYYEYVK